MQTTCFLIAVFSFLVILIIVVLINREKIKQEASRGNNLPSSLAMFGMFLVPLAIVVEENVISISLISLGVML